LFVIIRVVDAFHEHFAVVYFGGQGGLYQSLDAAAVAGAVARIVLGKQRYAFAVENIGCALFPVGASNLNP